MNQSDVHVAGLINIFNRSIDLIGADLYRLMGAMYGFMVRKRFNMHGMSVTDGRFRQVTTAGYFKKIFASFPDLYNLLINGFRRTLGPDAVVTNQLMGTVGSVSVAIGCDELVGGRPRVRLYLHMF